MCRHTGHSLASRFDSGYTIITPGVLLTLWYEVGLFNPYLMRAEGTNGSKRRH